MFSQEFDDLNNRIMLYLLQTFFPTKKFPGPGGFIDKFYQKFKKEIILIHTNSLRKLKMREEFFPTHSPRSASPRYQNQLKTLQ